MGKGLSNSEEKKRRNNDKLERKLVIDAYKKAIAHGDQDSIDLLKAIYPNIVDVFKQLEGVL